MVILNPFLSGNQFYDLLMAKAKQLGVGLLSCISKVSNSSLLSPLFNCIYILVFWVYGFKLLINSIFHFNTGFIFHSCFFFLHYEALVYLEPSYDPTAQNVYSYHPSNGLKFLIRSPTVRVSFLSYYNVLML